MNKEKLKFLKELQNFAKELQLYLENEKREWVVKGFIDVFKNIFSITNDAKIVSKVLEIHIFPKFIEFANKHNYKMEFATHQNWYPDITFISKENESIKFAVDLKSSYISKFKENEPIECNGFTLGLHGEYFINRKSSKNIQYPYNEYLGHFILGILYNRNKSIKIDETKKYNIDELEKIPSVINNFIVFAQEKWRVASDKGGSGNTANIGSIKNIKKLINGEGIFWEYFKENGEKWFDDYWIDYGKIPLRDEKGNIILDKKGKEKTITSLKDYLKYRGIDDK